MFRFAFAAALCAVSTLCFGQIDGVLFTSNGQQLEGQIVYNYHDDLVHVIEQARVKTLSPASIARFEFADLGLERKRSFVSIKDGHSRQHLFEVLAEQGVYKVVRRKPLHYNTGKPLRNIRQAMYSTPKEAYTYVLDPEEDNEDQGQMKRMLNKLGKKFMRDAGPAAGRKDGHLYLYSEINGLEPLTCRNWLGQVRPLSAKRMEAVVGPDLKLWQSAIKRAQDKENGEQLSQLLLVLPNMDQTAPKLAL